MPYHLRSSPDFFSLVKTKKIPDVDVKDRRKKEKDKNAKRKRPKTKAVQTAKISGPFSFYLFAVFTIIEKVILNPMVKYFEHNAIL